MAISAETYFALHRLFAPVIRIYRWLHPVPKSPEPRSSDEEASLTLVPVERLTERMVELLQFLVRESPERIGNYAEFGVYNGTSMVCMYRAISRLGLTQVKLLGFDSFQGLPPDVSNDDGGVWRAGQFSCPVATTLKRLEENSVPRDRYRLTSGWYKDTLRQPASLETTGYISIVMIDSDAYLSAKSALRFIDPMLTDVAVIMFDDWKLNDLDLKGMGEYRAFREFLQSKPEYHVVFLKGYNRKSKIAIIRRVPI